MSRFGQSIDDVKDNQGFDEIGALKDTGGPAFPSHGTMGEVLCHGMDLRDYFAAQAMLGMIGAPMGKLSHQTKLEDIALDAYKMADGMIAERNKS